MNPRRFTTKGELCHRKWLSSILDIPFRTNGGIDLANEDIGIELKCRYKKYNHQFTVHEYQLNRFQEENPGKKLYWAFLLYDLKKQPDRIGNANCIENAVSNREVWFFEWNWIKQFPVSHPKTGPYVYIKEKFFPPPEYLDKFEAKGGTLYLPKNIELEAKN